MAETKAEVAWRYPCEEHRRDAISVSKIEPLDLCGEYEEGICYDVDPPVKCSAYRVIIDTVAEAREFLKKAVAAFDIVNRVEAETWTPGNVRWGRKNQDKAGALLAVLPEEE